MLQEFSSLNIQFKMLLSIGTLFYLRYKLPDVHRPMRVSSELSLNFQCSAVHVTHVLALAGQHCGGSTDRPCHPRHRRTLVLQEPVRVACRNFSLPARPASVRTHCASEEAKGARQNHG